VKVCFARKQQKIYMSEIELVELADPQTGKIFFINIQSGALFNELPPLAKL
jgi:hypothetical protein